MKRTTKAKVGAMSTRDHKDPKPAAKKPVAPKVDDVPAGNQPVHPLPEQEQTERERLRPIDQP